MVPGIDCSHWHPVTNWALLAQNARFVGIKATEGNTVTDPTLQQHRRGFAGSGMDLAIYYHLARPGDAAAQALRFVETVGPLLPHERLCLDIERSSGISQEWLDAFFWQLGGTYPAVPGRPIVYASPGSWAANGLDPNWAGAKDCDLWLAHYAPAMGPPAPPWTTTTFWQWSESESVPGVDGPCDANWFLGDGDALKAYAALTG